jgi:exodeoxyribonuclease VII large subunit
MAGILTVDELTRYIGLLFDENELLSRLQVRGTLSGFKRHTSGHVYFTLLGDQARISCALFRSDAGRVPQWPADGDEVLVTGKAGVYGPRGTYQIYARTIRPLGEAAQTRAKKELLERLRKEGLFEPSVKRKLPPLPMEVALVTSPTGAAVKDVVKVARQRFPLCRIVVVPTLVQGSAAVEEIARGLARAGSLPGVEAVMLVRGGGSRDDLNPFDEEEVVRAVRGCRVPVITGLGHQVDRTLSDLAADYDAPTPSAAAEALFPDRRDLLRQMASSKARMRGSLDREMHRHRMLFDGRVNSLARSFERSALFPAEADLERLRVRAAASVERIAALAWSSFGESASALDALSPLKTLARGFASCSKPDGSLVARAALVSAGDDMVVTFMDGRATTTVASISEGPPSPGEDQR